MKGSPYKILVISVLMMVAMCISVNAVNAEITTTCNSTEVKCGESVTITMELSENPGIGIMVISPIYDDSILTLTAQNISNGDVFDFVDTMSIQNITFMDTNALSLSGKVATFTFIVNPQASLGDTTVEFVVNEIFDQEYNPTVQLTIQPVTLTIKADVPSVGETVTGYSLTLQGGGSGDIGVNLGIKMSDELKADADAYVSIQKNGATHKVPVSELEFDGNGKALITSYVSAKNMGDVITATVFNGNGESGASYSYSVKEYAEYIIENSVNYEASLVSLVKSMLNYGSAAQEHFGYNTTVLVNESLSEQDKNAVDNCTEVGSASDREVAKTGTAADVGVASHSTTLLLGAQTTIRHYITLENGVNISDLTLTVNGSTVTAKQDGDRYAIDISEIAAANYDKTYVLQITKGASSYSSSYSVVNYLSRMFDSYKNDAENVSFVKLLKSMYLYNLAAENYFN